MIRPKAHLFQSALPLIMLLRRTASRLGHACTSMSGGGRNVARLINIIEMS